MLTATKPTQRHIRTLPRRAKMSRDDVFEYTLQMLQRPEFAAGMEVLGEVASWILPHHWFDPTVTILGRMIGDTELHGLEIGDAVCSFNGVGRTDTGEWQARLIYLRRDHCGCSHTSLAHAMAEAVAHVLVPD